MFPLTWVSHGSRPLHPGAALGSGVAAIGMLLFLPSAAEANPDLGLVPGLGGAAWWMVAVVLLVQAVAVAWTGRAPEVVVPGLAAVALVLIPVEPGPAFTFTAVAVLVSVFLAVVARPARRLWGPLLAAGVLLATGQFLTADPRGVSGVGAAGTGAALQALLVIGLPLLFGSVTAARRDAHEARRLELAALRREQDALLQAAISRQRTALSRELHDIAAHHLSGIAMLAGAVARQIDTNPATAKHSVAQIREQSRAVLADLRRLVGLLREETDAARPVETLDAVAGLVEARRAAGAEIELRMPLRGEAPGPLAQLVAYRMVQESLANAAVHAPGAPCTVEIGEPREGWLTISVRNGVPTSPDPGPGSGFGLVGMAERAQLVGADLDHGPTLDGGWEVRLRLPLGETVSTMCAPATLPEVSHDPRAHRR
ncbi:sensor histidine kinase [Kibdelosporangium aridum]|uniref:histidine kinase n=1 Tax=Kibdelosporangium aridum TaxID=2030 RepID=A0A1Y5YCH8_KIBAR|nr:histidine kinase [Kibdelosporangium aridum]SMD27052.1 Signal transduction histidine kinase [Kibdelosporangium aridum]